MQIKHTDELTNELYIREAMTFDMSTMAFSTPFLELGRYVIRNGKRVDVRISDHRTVEAAQAAAAGMFGPADWVATSASTYRAELR